jgi:hypothetical protein
LTIEVVDAESQVVLNTHTEHNFQDAFKKVEEAVGTVHKRGRDCFKGDGGQWAKN